MRISPRAWNRLFYSILFYSILFYSILFYSILFYSMHPSIHPSIHPSVRPSVRPSILPPASPSVRPFIRPSVQLSVQNKLPQWNKCSVYLSISARPPILFKFICCIIDPLFLFSLRYPRMFKQSMFEWWNVCWWCKQVLMQLYRIRHWNKMRDNKSVSFPLYLNIWIDC